MILITLGTQDKPFYRLLNAIEEQIKNGKIKEDIIVQAGCTKFTSETMKVLDLIPYDEFDYLVKKCDILITHGGVGSIITALKNNKKVIAVARLSKYKESANDHQLQIIENFSKDGYILSCDNLNDMYKKIEETKHFKPKKFVSSTPNMIKLIEEYINNN